MRVLRSIDGLAEIPGPVVIAAGVFDGMHLGHRMVLETAQRESQKLAATAVALIQPANTAIAEKDRLSMK